MSEYNEPWRVEQRDSSDYAKVKIWTILGEGGREVLDARASLDAGSTCDPCIDKDHAERAVACVNAMEGIRDPEEFMRQFKEMVQWRGWGRGPLHPQREMFFDRLDELLACFDGELPEYT